MGGDESTVSGIPDAAENPEAVSSDWQGIGLHNTLPDRRDELSRGMGTAIDDPKPAVRSTS